MDGDVGVFNWSRVSEAVILVANWASWFFSMSLCRGWNIQGCFFISISGAWRRMAGSAWASWSLLSCQTASLHVAGLPHRMAVSETYLTVGFSQIECSKNHGRAAWLPGPSLWRSRTLLANYVIASSGSKGWETLHHFDGKRSKESVVIFGPHRRRIPVNSLRHQTLSWNVSGVPPGLRFILSNAWQSSFSSGCHQRT